MSRATVLCTFGRLEHRLPEGVYVRVAFVGGQRAATAPNDSGVLMCVTSVGTGVVGMLVVSARQFYVAFQSGPQTRPFPHVFPTRSWS